MTEEPAGTAAHAALDDVFVDQAERRTMMQQLLRSADLAEAAAPGAWCASFNSDRSIRLTVGNVEVLAFTQHEHGVRLNCIGGAPDLVRRLGDYIDTPAYKSIRSSAWAFLGPASVLTDIAEELHDPHRRFVEEAGRTKTGKRWRATPFAARHSALLMDYARTHAALPAEPVTPRDPAVAVAGDGPAAVVITWSVDGWAWSDLEQAIARTESGKPYRHAWSTGSTKRIPVGTRVFLLRQNREPRGIMGSGRTVAAVSSDAHWDPVRAERGETANFVKVDFDVLLSPDIGNLLDPASSADPVLAEKDWGLRSSGQRLTPEVTNALEKAWRIHSNTDERGRAIDFTLSALEGEERLARVKARRREGRLRTAKLNLVLASGSLRCEVPRCGFDFQAIYGELGAGYAEVHHLEPIGSRVTPTRTTLDDLAVVCANCHAMIHRGGGCRPLDEIIPDGRAT